MSSKILCHTLPFCSETGRTLADTESNRIHQPARALLLRVPDPRRRQRGPAEGRRRGARPAAGRVVHHPRDLRRRRPPPRGSRPRQGAQRRPGRPDHRQRARLLRRRRRQVRRLRGLEPEADVRAGHFIRLRWDWFGMAGWLVMLKSHCLLVDIGLNLGGKMVSPKK